MNVTLPVCRHRSGPIGPGIWRCASPKVVTPGNSVTSEMCAGSCPYVDHETDPRFPMFSGGGLRFLPGNVARKDHPNTTKRVSVDVRPELFAIGMLTAPRPVSTVMNSLSELRKAGFGQQVHLFAEPGSDLQNLSSGVSLFTNTHLRGVWGNWRNAATRLLELSDAPWLLICEDDLRLRCDSACALQAVIDTMPHHDWGYASLYTPWHNIVGQRVRRGWQDLDVGSNAWGALAYCFSRESLQAVLATTPAAIEQPAFLDTDILISQACKRIRRKLYFHLPSLCEHAGAGNSTLGHPALNESDAVDFNPRRVEYVPHRNVDNAPGRSSSGEFPDRAPTAPIRVAFIGPVLLIGGVEMWLAGLVRYSDPARVQWHVGVTTEGAIESFTQKQLAPFVSLVSGRSAIRQMVQEMDLVLVWFLDGPREWIGDFAGPVVAVAHGSCLWTERWIKNASAAVTDFAAVSHIAATKCHAQQVRVIENGIDTQRCKAIVPRAETRSSWGLQPDDVAVGYVGRIVHDKNCLPIAQSARLLASGFRSVFIGPTYDLAYADQIRIADPNCIFVPTLEQIGNALAALDVMVMVSPSEGGPLVVLEAMLAGIPVVATPVGLIPDIMRRFGEVCVIVPINPTPQEIAEAIVQAISPEWRRTLPLAAGIVRDHFTSERMANDWMTYFEELTSLMRN